MEYVTLGRTGLTVSRVGLGCGGPSRLGQSYGSSVESSRRVVERALSLGITFFDSAEGYHTEEVLGEALAAAGQSSNVVVSTKKAVWDWEQKRLISASEMALGVEASLKRLRRERIDVFHLHSLGEEHVDYALSEILPVLVRQKEQGKIGHLAASEGFGGDTQHRMLARVLPQDVFDVVMVGFNLLNPSARKLVFPETSRRKVGTLVMFAVRRALSNPERLAQVLEDLLGGGTLERSALRGQAPKDALAFLSDVRDAGYRFCRHEPGADVILTGTGSVEHLEQNVASLLSPPLPAETLERLSELFGHVDSVSGN